MRYWMAATPSGRAALPLNGCVSQATPVAFGSFRAPMIRLVPSRLVSSTPGRARGMSERVGAICVNPALRSTFAPTMSSW